ncbi:MAG: LON peptidase substrate-binding domain-containing protein [Verrucomicrobia bacterium]|nr:LON peptidase substrate-binding domain-containing protein [Verrucomicrobiota bacterium]
MVPLFIFEPRYRSLLADALRGERMMCLAMRQPGAGTERPSKLAGLGLIRVSVTNPNGTSHLMLQGLTRVRLGRAVQTKPYRVHRIEPVEEPPTETLASEALAGRLLDLVETRLRLGVAFPLAAVLQLAGVEEPSGTVRIEDCLRALRGIPDPGSLADLVTTLLVSNAAMRQVVLQTLDVEERLRHVVHFLAGEIEGFQKKAAQ